MAMAMLARAFSLRRANQRAKKVNARLVGDSATDLNGTGSLSPEQSDYIHSSRVSQSIDALYVLSCLRDGLSLVDTFASEEESAARISTSGARLSEEKLARSSVSLNSEHACPSEFAWDRFSSSLSSSSSDSTIVSSSLGATAHVTTRQDDNHNLNIRDADDFCLVFRKEHQPLSSPSPPTGITSDCCSFLMGRKSSHSEEDVRGSFGRKDDPRAGAGENNPSKFSTKRGEKSRESLNSAGSEAGNGRCKWLLPMYKNVSEGDDLHRLLIEGAMEAVEKQSGNPYLDFRESMLEMLMAACSKWNRCREGDATDTMSTGDDLNISIEDLLYCYLRLNSMELYELITQAFSDTCSEWLAVKSF